MSQKKRSPLSAIKKGFALIIFFMALHFIGVAEKWEKEQLKSENTASK